MFFHDFDYYNYVALDYGMFGKSFLLKTPFLKVQIHFLPRYIHPYYCIVKLLLMHIVEDFKIQCLWRDFFLVKQIIIVLVLHTTTITLGYSLFKKRMPDTAECIYVLRIHICSNPLSGLSYFTPPFFACDQLTYYYKCVLFQLHILRLLLLVFMVTYYINLLVVKI